MSSPLTCLVTDYGSTISGVPHGQQHRQPGRHHQHSRCRHCCTPRSGSARPPSA